MNSKKLFRVLMIVAALLGVGLLASVYGANKMLAGKSDELVALKAANIATTQQEADLVQAKQDVGRYRELNKIAESVVPQDKDQARTVREIVDLAKQSGIARLSSVAFPPSNLGGASKTKSPGGLTQVTPVKGLGGVVILPITITQSNSEPIPYSNFIAFLSKLEHNRRTALVSSINIQPDAEKPDMVSFTLVIDEYIKL
jgi:hypothetical protein